MGSAIEVVRLAAVNLDEASGSPPEGGCSLVVHNPLAAPVWILFGPGDPGPGNYDVVAPGNALMAYPLPPSVSLVTAKVRYPGAVPAGDAGLHAAILVTGSNQGTSVGPLA